MKTNTSEKTICVVGASGLVGSNIVKAALERGYHVRGTMRDKDAPTKAPFLRALPGASERLSLFMAITFKPMSSVAASLKLSSASAG